MPPSAQTLPVIIIIIVLRSWFTHPVLLTRKMDVFFFIKIWISNLKNFFWIKFNPTYCGYGLPIQYFSQEKWTYFSSKHWISNLKIFFWIKFNPSYCGHGLPIQYSNEWKKNIFFCFHTFYFRKLRMSQLPFRITHVRPSLVIIPF